MSPSTNFWLAVGRHINWLTSFERRNMWGLKVTQRRYWEAITPHTDLVFFYVTVPVGGVVGYGHVRNKLKQTSPNWAEELLRNQVIWPLRFEFDVLSAIPPHRWRDEKVALHELKPRARSGFQALERDLAERLIRALPGQFPATLPLAAAVAPPGNLVSPVSLGAPFVPEDPHDRTQWHLVQIGQIQRYLANREYPLDTRRLDVVWRRVEKSVPSYAFEVQVSGNITEALAKLKQARDLWNSNIFLVGQEEHRAPVNQLLGGAFHEIHDRLRFLELAQVEELYQRKRAYRELENQLGILG